MTSHIISVFILSFFFIIIFPPLHDVNILLLKLDIFTFCLQRQNVVPRISHPRVPKWSNSDHSDSRNVQKTSFCEQESKNSHPHWLLIFFLCSSRIMYLLFLWSIKLMHWTIFYYKSNKKIFQNMIEYSYIPLNVSIVTLEDDVIRRNIYIE